jgi:hypothetical protein
VPDVFVSYARTDQEFVRRLVKRLTLRGREVWIDWEDILPTADWMQEITRAIDVANAFIFVITPNSVASEVCRTELDLASTAGKRIVPILHHEVPAKDMPSAVAGLNWLLFRQEDDFAEALDSLVLALELDLEWVRFHTRLLIRAREWRDHDGDDSYLLAGSDLEEAQKFLAAAVDKDPRVSPLQTAYVAESEVGGLSRQRREVRGFYIVSLTFGVLQAAVIYGVAFDKISESGLLMLAPLWIFSLAFGGSGLLMARPTLIKMGAIAIAVIALMIFFYLTLWPVL